MTRPRIPGAQRHGRAPVLPPSSAVPCPTCGALIGLRCSRHDGIVLAESHPARVVRAEAVRA